MDNTQTGVPTFGGPEIPQPQVPEATCSVRLSARDEAEIMAAAEQPPAPRPRRLCKPPDGLSSAMDQTRIEHLNGAPPSDCIHRIPSGTTNRREKRP